ncbi:MAG: hypothetical protein H6581_30945 [Bacteroidia bacterium]|nr:hypothetical protein [Bacteroidia bacterium]
MKNPPVAIQSPIILPVKGNTKVKAGLFIAGGAMCLIGLAFSGFKGAFYGKSEGLIYMAMYMAQGIFVAGIGFLIKPGQVEITNEGLNIRSASAKFAIDWNSLEQVRIESDKIKFWDDKGMKIFPTKNLAPADLETLVNVLEPFDSGSGQALTGLRGFGGQESTF